jgi:hypothetical protein
MPPDNLADFVLGPDDEPPNRKKATRHKVGRLPALPGHYVRVPVSWICKPLRGKYRFPPEYRLFFYLLYRSHWGQRGVPVTAAFRAEVQISRSGCWRALERFEHDDLVRVERHRGRSPIVWPIVLNE